MRWTDYSPDELDHQYDNRAAVPEHPEIFEQWRARSVLARHSLNARLDIRYGSHERQVLDLFLPSDSGAALHVFFHGGYWQAMSKNTSSFVAEALVRGGSAVAVVNYRLCPEVRVGDIVADARAACGWLWRHGREFDVDASRMRLSGHSAGGHLVGMLCATAPSQIDPDLPEDWIHSAIGLSGLFDLEPLTHTKVNGLLGMSAVEAQQQSPTRLPPRKGTRLRLAVGALESQEYHRQSAALAAAWEGKGAAVDVVRLEGRNHFTILDELGSEGSVLSLFAHGLSDSLR